MGAGALIQLEHTQLHSGGARPDARPADANGAPDPSQYNFFLRSTQATFLSWGHALDDDEHVDTAAAW